MTARLEDLRPDGLVQGLVGREAVRIVSAEMLGDMACKMVYRGQDGALADAIDEATSRYSGLRPQQASSSQLPNLNSLIVKDEVAQAQIAAEKAAAQQAATATDTRTSSFTATSFTNTDPTNPGIGRAVVKPAGEGTTTDPTTTSAESTKPALPTRYVASVKLDPTRASLQMSTFVEEVMSHLQALPGAQIEMTLEVQVNAPGGIDEQTARIVLENSAALKVEKPGLY
jgi:hypothetical protein